MEDGGGHALREIVGRLRAHGAHRQAEQGQFAAAAVEVLRPRREGVLAVARRDLCANQPVSRVLGELCADARLRADDAVA